jgi:hypothetical protein
MLDKATYLKPAVMFGSKTIQVQPTPRFPLNRDQPFPSRMSYSRRPKAERRRGRLTDTSIAGSKARDMQSTEVMSNETGEGVYPSLISRYA